MAKWVYIIMMMLAYSIMAMPGTLIPQSGGMNMHGNTYWSLGWPFPQEFTVYGRNNGYSEMSIPSLSGLALNFSIWFVIAAMSHRIWVILRADQSIVSGFLLAILYCFWVLLLLCFAVFSGYFMLRVR